jgi:hypothetical protein
LQLYFSQGLSCYFGKLSTYIPGVIFETLSTSRFFSLGFQALQKGRQIKRVLIKINHLEEV